jgi:(p)ppGpp synthase/HD superfamily hydrolase
MTVLSSRFRDALMFAAQLHSKQMRKSKPTPYFAHLMGVAGIVLENGGSEDAAIAALLHDAVEDQGGKHTRERIRELFGDEVVRIVDGCSDTDQMPKPPWQQRKEGYLARLREEEDVEVRLVSLADKLHNGRELLYDYRAIGAAVWSQFNAGRDSQLWYYRSVSNIFCEKGPFPLAYELCRVVDELEKLVEERE